MVSTLLKEKKNTRLMQMKKGEYTFRRKRLMKIKEGEYNLRRKKKRLMKKNDGEYTF